MKPRAPINTAEKFKQAREYMELDKAGLARLLRLGATGNSGRETVRRIEAGARVPGIYQIAMEALLTGWRPKDSPRKDRANG